MEMIQNWMNGFLILSLVIIIAGAIAVGIMIASQRGSVDTRKDRENLVRKYSIRYAQILELNSTAQFTEIEETQSIETICDTKSEFEKFDPDQYLLYSLLYYGREDEIEDFYYIADFYKKMYRDYLKRVSEIPPTSEEHIKQHTTMNVDAFLAVENSLCAAEILEPPKEPILIVKAYYSSQKGRNSHAVKKQYTVEEIGKLLQTVEKRKEENENRQNTHYLLTDIYKYKGSRAYYGSEFNRQQRSLMTKKMRYEVLKRDHFRCTICGASAANGVELEVDHIKPVSKGGKTEPSNLRTLCKSCNRGKRDRYDPGGLN